MQHEHDPFSEEQAPAMSERLFELDIEGRGSQTEGILSWLVGLAQAHRLGPRTMMKHLLSTHPEYSDIWSGSAFFERDCGTINGMGKYAAMAADVLQVSALPQSSNMTLRPLSALLPRNGEGLLSRRPRWCSFCICDQARAGARPHFPLLWSLEYYRVCHVHQTEMTQHCPACGTVQQFIPSFPSLVHCSTCGDSLVSEQASSSPEARPLSAFERWTSNALSRLIEDQDKLETTGSLEHLKSIVHVIVSRLNGGNRKELCEALGLQIYALNGWLNKDERPSMAVLLRFCYGVGIQPADIFLPGTGEIIEAPPIRTADGSARELRPLLGQRQRERLTSQLQIIIDDPADHRALISVSKGLGITRHALKYLFPQESRMIVLKNRACEARRIAARYQEEHDFLRQVVGNLYAQGIYPSRRKVNEQLHSRHITLMRPDIFLAYERARVAMMR